MSGQPCGTDGEATDEEATDEEATNEEATDEEATDEDCPKLQLTGQVKPSGAKWSQVVPSEFLAVLLCSYRIYQAL